MPIQNLENKIIFETCFKAKDMVVYKIFNINLIKLGQSNVTREKCFFPFKFGWSAKRAVTLLIFRCH